MRPVSTDAKNSAHAAPRWLAWIVGGVGVALCLFTLLLWGLNGPAFILDLIGAFCG
jgi:hypothetical protein